MNSFTVCQTYEVNLKGQYSLKYRAYYSDSPKIFIEDSFIVNIIDPCDEPKDLTLPDMFQNSNGLALKYNLAKEFKTDWSFDEFLA